MPTNAMFSLGIGIGILVIFVPLLAVTAYQSRKENHPQSVVSLILALAMVVMGVLFIVSSVRATKANQTQSRPVSSSSVTEYTLPEAMKTTVKPSR